ncbi:MAG: endolytic transglycosylase MltG [Eubacteriales bacterium]|nr:endolytic transglycosylase MltG [Eubacteriales bacterium]
MGNRKVRKNKKHFIIIFILIFILIFSFIFIFNSYLNKGNQAVNPKDSTLITVSIPNGTSTRGIGEILESKGLIIDSRLFRLKSRINGFDGKYKAGEYNLSPAMTMDEIITLILSGNDTTLRFTIPEGYDIRKTVAALESANLINSETFLREIETGSFSYDFLKDAPSGSNRLEGYLYPETYEVFANASERDIIVKMLDQFNKVFTEKYYKRAKELDMDINQVITLASIIEREAVIPEDRPIIAGVFYNRLKKGMQLQSCATVQYILGEQKPVLSVADTKLESPYNTYLITGLPPGPICSPGIQSINAALWPENTDYLYFLAKGDGAHVFSKTYEEHLINKEKYIDN